MNLSGQNKPTRFYNARLIRIEFAWLVPGSGTLWFIMPAAKPGWTSDPNPNSAGCGRV